MSQQKLTYHRNVTCIVFFYNEHKLLLRLGFCIIIFLLILILLLLRLFLLFKFIQFLFRFLFLPICFPLLLFPSLFSVFFLLFILYKNKHFSHTDWVSAMKLQPGQFLDSLSIGYTGNKLAIQLYAVIPHSTGPVITIQAIKVTVPHLLGSNKLNAWQQKHRMWITCPQLLQKWNSCKSNQWPLDH